MSIPSLSIVFWKRALHICIYAYIFFRTYEQLFHKGHSINWALTLETYLVGMSLIALHLLSSTKSRSVFSSQKFHIFNHLLSVNYELKMCFFNSSMEV